MLMLMPMLRFPNGCFSAFCQFCMEKKEFAVEMRTLYDFPYFLMHIGSFDVISNYSKTNLLGIYVFKVDNKNTRTRYEKCLKLKLKNKYIRMTLSNGVLLSLFITLNIFLTWF